MAGYLLFLTGALGLLAAFVALLVLHGGWEAAAAGLAVGAGALCLTGMIAALIGADRMPRGPRGRPL